MDTSRHQLDSVVVPWLLCALVAIVVAGVASCTSSQGPTWQGESPAVPGWPAPDRPFVEARYPTVRGEPVTIEGAEFIHDDEFCLACHEAHGQSFAQNVHRDLWCEDCHGPASRHLDSRGKVANTIFGFKGSVAARSEACLRCHEEHACSEGARWRTSAHANAGVACTDCHRGHYNLARGTPTITGTDPPGHPWDWRSIQLARYAPAKERVKPRQPPLTGTSGHLGAQSPGVCYRCHEDKQAEEGIAGPHQICGPNGFNCTTCHDPHGQVREESRSELCLECHSGTPTTSWHASIHFDRGVACTDCHWPHPTTRAPRLVNLSHTHIPRPPRLPMGVQEPEICFKCHKNIYGLTRLRSHHPILEGKMVCTDCHDPHGQTERNLNAPIVNDVCYRCHGDKQGPFVYEHPPVIEDCGYCHDPHGATNRNLLRESPTMLCLRCHSGHRSDRWNIDANPGLRPALYSNCMQCHPQIHGSNFVNQSGKRSNFAR